MLKQVNIENGQKKDELENKIDNENEPRKRIVNREISWKEMIPSCIYGLLLIAQIVLVFFFYNYESMDYLTWIGWGFLIPLCIFGRLPVIEFQKHGRHH